MIRILSVSQVNQLTVLAVFLGIKCNPVFHGSLGRRWNEAM